MNSGDASMLATQHHPWDSQPISRADLDGWLRVFKAPDAAELALFDPPWQNQS
jgi:hypothetical protein